MRAAADPLSLPRFPASLLILLAAMGCGAKKDPAAPQPGQGQGHVEHVDAIALVGLDDSDPPAEDNDKALARAQEVVESEALRFKGCYERAHEADKTTSGMVKVKLDIDDKGVPKPKVLCSSVPAALTTCIVEAFAQMRFEPPPNGKKSLTLPVYMQPKGAPKAPACNADPGGTKM
jgi:hypothetical protein